jgi:signal transduction histidine kinase
LGWWYARRTLKPIRRLLLTITTIEKGHLSERVSVDESGDELNELGKTFNRMIERLEKLVAIMKESLDNVAHDIRTPLTRIKVVAEDALLSGKPAAQQEALADCAENVTVISDMVNQLMSISEAGAGTLSLNYEFTNIRAMIKNVAEVYDFVAYEKSIQVVCLPMDPRLHWALDRKRIQQVIANLLDNALKFSPEQTRVEIFVEVVDKQLKLSIKDQGPGIPPSEIDRIWDRLFRGDKSRTTKGSGLGLSIAKAVVLAHGGTLEVSSVLGQGAVFTLSLPNSDIIQR